MYHASPSLVYESIVTKGIDYRIHFRGRSKLKDTRDITYAPRGNYLMESYESCVDYARSFKVPYDVWEIDTKGINFKADEAWYKGWFTKSRIESYRIKLMQKSI